MILRMLFKVVSVPLIRPGIIDRVEAQGRRQRDLVETVKEAKRGP